MKNKKATFIIDGNYHLFRSLFVLPKTDGKHINTDSDAKSYMQKIATDLAYKIRALDGLIDEVVWTIDSKSWRKDFYPEAQYKANRKSNDTINWENFSKISSEFVEILKEKGVVISKINGAEGDDLMYSWSVQRMSKGKPVILSTGDGDMLQTISEQNNVHSIVLSPANKKLNVPIGFENWLNESSIEKKPDNELDIFNAMKISVNSEQLKKNLWKSFIKNKKYKLVEVDTIYFLFKKVLTGDGGDNVPPAYYYTTTSKAGNTRRYGVSDKKATLIIEDFVQKHGNLLELYLFSNDLIMDLADSLVKVMKPKYMSREQIFRNLKMNIDLMVLSNRTIPEGILNEMLGHIETNSDNIDINFDRITKMQNMLKGTLYEPNKRDSKSMTSSFFGKDNSNDFSFIKKKDSPNNKLF